MKVNVCRFSGDSDLFYDITECLRNRKLNQKYAYIWDGWSTYYSYNTSFSWVKTWSASEIESWIDMLKNYINVKEIDKQMINFISIACGNSHKEKEIINGLWLESINYIGVDHSENMIMLSGQNLQHELFESYLIRSDIVDIAFKRYLDTLVKRNDKRFFSFLGNTFWNIKTTNVADLLGSYLKRWDMLWMDATLVKSMWVQSSINIFNHYKEKTKNNETWRNYILWWLNYIKFPIEKWEIIIRIEEDFNIGSYRVIFSLKLLENMEFNLEWAIIFSQWEQIQFFEVYFYEPTRLIEFMKVHHFRLLTSQIDEVRGRFLFEKE